MRELLALQSHYIRVKVDSHVAIVVLHSTLQLKYVGYLGLDFFMKLGQLQIRISGLAPEGPGNVCQLPRRIRVAACGEQYTAMHSHVEQLLLFMRHGLCRMCRKHKYDGDEELFHVRKIFLCIDGK